MVDLEVENTIITNMAEEEKVLFTNNFISSKIAIDYKTFDYVVQNYMKEFYKKKLDEAVNHPNHYASHPSGVECIELTELMSFCKGNAFKYVWRAGKKFDAEEDLKKAKFYLNRCVQNEDISSALFYPDHYEMMLRVVTSEKWESKGKALFFIATGYLELGLKYIEEMEKDIESQKRGEKKNG